MVLCSQSPLSPPSYFPFPPPLSKSPPAKASRKLQTLKDPLTDVTNFTLAQAMLEFPNLAHILPRDECPLGRARGDAPPRRGRGKNRRGRQRGVRPREAGGSMPSGAVLRPPVPLAASSPRSPFHPPFDFRVARRKSKAASPILFNGSSHKSFHNNTTTFHPRTPRRHYPSVSTVTPESSTNPYNKRGRRWSSNSPRGRLVSPPNSPTPTLFTRGPPYARKPSPDAPRRVHKLSFPTPLRFPIPPSSTPAFSPPEPHSTLEKQISLIPSMNLGSGIIQGQARKKRTKRELAEVQWQIIMHKSLAWRTTRDQINMEKKMVCEHCANNKENLSHGVMDFAQGGLKIALERPVCTCSSNELQLGNRGPQLHWTDSLDQELVKRLWVKLIAQGCRTIPTDISNRSQGSMPFPTVEPSPPGIPFPSGQSEQPLAPAIQLSSNSSPTSDPQTGAGIPFRQRVTAIASSSKTRPHVSLLNMHVSPQKPCPPATMPPSSSFTADSTDPYSQCQTPRVSGRMPRGTLSSAQLAAQALLRHGDARLKPMRRGRPPGLKQKQSSLHHEVTAEHAD